MRLDEIIESVHMFGGDRIDHMAGDNVPSEQEDSNASSYREMNEMSNERKRKIRKAIAKVKNRNKPWTIEQKMDASPSTAEHDLGQTDAALAGVMNGKNPYPGHQGI